MPEAVVWDGEFDGRVGVTNLRGLAANGNILILRGVCVGVALTSDAVAKHGAQELGGVGDEGNTG